MTAFEERYAVTSAGRIAYVDEGSGPAVLLLHGFPTSSHMWRDLVPILAPRFRAVAPDLPGYGDSSKPAGLTVEMQAQAVRELMAELDVDRPAMVGHDIGGGIALLLARDAQVGTVVLLDAAALGDWSTDAVGKIAEFEPGEMTPEAAEEMAAEVFGGGMSRRDRLAPEDLEEYLRPWRDESEALLRAARAVTGAGPPEGELASLDQRFLIVWGEEDPYRPPEQAERLGQLIPGATVGILPGCAHFVLEDAAETVAPLVAGYLQTHELGGHTHAGPTSVELGISFDRPERPSTPEGFEDLDAEDG